MTTRQESYSFLTGSISEETAMPFCRVYARGSTEEQQETILAQIATLTREYEHRFKETHAWGGAFADQGVSGKIKFRHRPEGFKLNSFSDKGDIILITKLDRGFRDARDLLDTHEFWEKKGVRLVMLDLQLDTGTPAGRLVLAIMAHVAEFERNRISERTKEINADKRRRGIPTNQHAGYGFLSVGTKGNRKRVPDPYTRNIGRQIVEWIDAGWTLDSVWRNLLQNRILTRDGALWSRSKIDRTYHAEVDLQTKEKETKT